MRKKQLLVLVLAVFLSLNLVGKSVTFQADVTSRFIWRGFDLLPDNNSALQPSLTFDLGDTGFALNIWASFALTDRDIYKYNDEIDVTLTYAFNTPENLSLLVGFTNYGWWFADEFKFKDNTTQEFFVELGFPRVPLAPKVTAYYDINLGDGLYVKLAGGHELAIGQGLKLNLTGALGYNGGMFLPDGADKGFSDLTFGASLPLSIGKLTIAPFVNYTFVFLDSVNEDNELWFGASLIF